MIISAVNWLPRIILLYVCLMQASEKESILLKFLWNKPKYLKYTTLNVNTVNKKNVPVSLNMARQCRLFSMYEDDQVSKIIELPFSSTVLKRCDALLKFKYLDHTCIEQLDYVHRAYDKIKQLYWACDFMLAPLEIQEQLLDRILYLTNRPADLDQCLFDRIMLKKDIVIGRAVRGFCRKHSHCFINTRQFDRQLIKNFYENSMNSVRNVTLYSADGSLEYYVHWNAKTVFIQIKDALYGLIFDGFFNRGNAKEIVIGEVGNYLGIILKNSKDPSNYSHSMQHIMISSIYFNVVTSRYNAKNLISQNHIKALLPYIKYENEKNCCNNALEQHTYIVLQNPQ